MRVEIFKTPLPVGAWAPVGPEYTFRPVNGDQGVYAVVDVPEGWLLVGEPEPLLVRPNGPGVWISRTATEVLYQAAMGAENFAVVEMPGAENIETANPEPPRAVLYYRGAVQPERPSLPDPPRRKGKADLPVRRRK